MITDLVLYLAFALYTQSAYTSIIWFAFCSPTVDPVFRGKLGQMVITLRQLQS